MNLYIYSDESGVFDKVHNDYFVFGAVIFLSSKKRLKANNSYLKVENRIKNKYNNKNAEMKGNFVSVKHKRELFQSLNKAIKVGAVIYQDEILDEIFAHKKVKQRYLDFVYKVMIKKALVELDKKGVLSLADIENINFYCDEHTTATGGESELKEYLTSDFKYGSFNGTFTQFFKPICPNLENLNLQFYDSKKITLVRAADIIANRIYHHALENTLENIEDKIYLSKFPKFK